MQICERCLSWSSLAPVIIYSTFTRHNKSSPRDCKVSQAAYPMYISCTFIYEYVYNGDMKADVHGYFENCDSSHFQ